MKTFRSFPGNGAVSVILKLLCLLAVAQAVPQWHNATDGHSYMIEGEMKYNWFAATHECARKNLKLVEIESQSKNDALVALLKKIFGNSRNLWLGANDQFSGDRNHQRPFYWSASGQRMTFSYWSNDNPDNYRSNEHCAHTWDSAPDFRWNDNNCGAVIGYICEEHHLSELANKVAAEAQQELQQAMSKLQQTYEEQQQKQTSRLDLALKEFSVKENELKEQLQSIHTKLEFDVTHALAQHQRDINSAVADRNKEVRNLNEEMKSNAEVVNKQIAKELANVQQVMKKHWS